MKSLARLVRDHLDAATCLALFAGALLLYVWTAAPTVSEIYDDSMEFPVVVHRLAIAHPTGYPLYTIVGKLFTLLPFGDVARALIVFSAVSAAGAVALVYVAMRRFDLHRTAGLAAALALLTSQQLWSQALISEVYALNAFFYAALFALAAEWGRPGGRRFTTLGAIALVLGMALTHHRTIVLILPGLLVYMVWVYWSERPMLPFRITRRHILSSAALFCLPLLLYLYIPLRGRVTTSLDGTYENTLSGFLSWVMAGSYVSLLTGDPMGEPALSASRYVGLLVEQVGVLGIALALAGSLWLLARRPKAATLLGLTWLCDVVFVRLYRVYDQPVFLIPSFMVVAMAAGAALDMLVSVALPAVRRPRARPQQAPPAPADAPVASADAPAPSRPASLVADLRVVAALALAVTVPALIFGRNYHAVDRKDDWAVHNYAIDALSQPLDSSAGVVGILGEMTLLNYYRETKAMRPELQTIAADSDAERRSQVDALMAAGQAVYLTRALPGLDQAYSLDAMGPLIHVGKMVSDVTTAQSAASTPRLTFGDVIALKSYSLGGLSPEMSAQGYPQKERLGTVEAGGRLRLTLVWQALQQPQRPYRLTIRLKWPAGRLLAQKDAGPVHNAYPPSAWRPGELVTDIADVLVPVGTPPGSYDVEIGLYDPATLQLLPVGGQQGLATIGPVSVAQPREPVDPGSLPLTGRPIADRLSVPNGGYDYSLAGLGLQRVERSNLENEFRLYASGVSARILAPGRTVDVTLLWQALRAPSGDRVVFVQMVDPSGAVVATQESQPAEGLYPTSQWMRHELVRDIHTLPIPGDLRDGIYRLEAGMYDPSGMPLTVLRLTRRSLDHVDLGPVEVRGRPRTQDVPPMQFAIDARVGNVGKLLGFDLCANSVACAMTPGGPVARQGDNLNLRLYWQAAEPTLTSYTVFAHLLGPDGRVVSQEDTAPGRGALPTTSWARGEVLQDPLTMRVPANAAPGYYQIEVGMYDPATNVRLPTWDANGAAAGDSLMLTNVRVDRAP